LRRRRRSRSGDARRNREGRRCPRRQGALPASRARVPGGRRSGFAEAQSTVERYFAAYEVLDVSIRDVRIERAEGAARVRLRATLSGQPRRIGGLDGLVPSSAAYDFDLRLVPEGGAWKVSWAQWNPANLGGRND
jgi:hypothetical protein